MKRNNNENWNMLKQREEITEQRKIYTQKHKEVEKLLKKINALQDKTMNNLISNVRAFLKQDPSDLSQEELQNNYLKSADQLIKQMNNKLKN